MLFQQAVKKRRHVCHRDRIMLRAVALQVFKEKTPIVKRSETGGTLTRNCRRASKLDSLTDQLDSHILHYIAKQVWLFSAAGCTDHQPLLFSESRVSCAFIVLEDY